MNGRKNKYKTMRNRGQKGTAVFFIYQEKIRKLTVCRLVTPSIHAVSRDGAKFMVVNLIPYFGVDIVCIE